MQQRLTSIFLFLIIFIPLMYFGGWPFYIFMTAIAVIILREIIRMKGIPTKSIGAIMSYLAMIGYVLSNQINNVFPFFTETNIIALTLLLLLVYMLVSKSEITVDDIAVILFGLIYVGNGFQTFIGIRQIELYAIFYIMFVIWGTDSGAYVMGRLFGKRPLAPKISPNKTVEGSLGGILFAVVISWLYINFLPVSETIYPNVLVVILMSVSGQVGDLIESAMKRYYDVKDTGTILPGHGGMFDRFDSLIFVMNLIKLLTSFGIFAY